MAKHGLFRGCPFKLLKLFSAITKNNGLSHWILAAQEKFKARLGSLNKEPYIKNPLLPLAKEYQYNPRLEQAEEVPQRKNELSLKSRL